jgi:hypothetical protein
MACGTLPRWDCLPQGNRAFTGAPCCRPCPRAAAGLTISLTQTQPYQPSPKGLSGRPAHRPFRALLGVHSRYGLQKQANVARREQMISFCGRRGGKTPALLLSVLSGFFMRKGWWNKALLQVEERVGHGRGVDGIGELLLVARRVAGQATARSRSGRRRDDVHPALGRAAPLAVEHPMDQDVVRDRRNPLRHPADGDLLCVSKKNEGRIDHGRRQGLTRATLAPWEERP